MADDDDSAEQQLFFVFDHSAMQREEDDLKDAIVYLHPQMVLKKKMLYEKQCNLCGQLMGMIRCVQDLTKSPPKCFKLKRLKFAIEYDGVYTVALAGGLSDPDSILSKRMKRLFSIFTFYHGSIEAVLQAEGNDRKAFLTQMARIWECYLPYVHNYGNLMAAVFNPLARVKFPKGQPSLFLKISHMLQCCQSHPGVMAGCLIYNNSVLYSQLSTDLLCRLLLLRPNQSNHPSNPVHTEFQVPVGVRIISVYLTSKEYRQLNHRRVSKHRRPVYTMMTPTIRRSPDSTGFDSRRFPGDSSSVSFHLSGSSPDISAMSDFDSDISSTRNVRWSSESSDSLYRRDTGRFSEDGTYGRDELSHGNMDGSVSESSSVDSRRSGRRTRQADFSVENLTRLIKTISGNCLEDLAKHDRLPEVSNETRESEGELGGKSVDGNEEVRSEPTSPNGVNALYKDYTIIEENDSEVLLVKNLPLDKNVDDVFIDTKVSVRKGKLGISKAGQEVNGVSANSPLLLETVHNVNGGGDLVTGTEILPKSKNKHCKDNGSGDAGITRQLFKDVGSSGQSLQMGRSQNKKDGKVSGSRTFGSETGKGSVNPARLGSPSKQDETSSLSDQEIARGLRNRGESTRTTLRQMSGSESGSERPLSADFDKESDFSFQSRPDSLPGSLQTLDDIDEEPDGSLKNVSLYVQGHSKIVLLLILEKRASKDESTIHLLWKSVLQQLGELEISIQHALERQHKKNRVKNYNYLVYDDDDKSLTGNLLEPVVATEHALCDVAKRLHHEFEQTEVLTDMTVRNFSTVVYGRHTLSKETYFQPKGVIRPNLGAPSCKDGALLLESKASSRLPADNKIVML